MAQKTFSESITADGDSATYEVREQGHGSGIDPVGYALGGTFGGGTVTLHVNFVRGGLFDPPKDGAWTEDIADKLDMPAGTQFKFVTTGSTTPSITLELRGYITKT